MRVNISKNNYQSQWVAEIALVMIDRNVEADLLKEKIAERDPMQRFFLEHNVIYGREYFPDFPSKEDIYKATEKLRGILENKAQTMLEIKEAIEIIKEAGLE